MTYIKLSCCKYCSLSFDNMSASQRANHSRWCNSNPKSVDYKKNLSNRSKKINTGRIVSEETKNKVRQAHLDGRYAHIDYSKMNISRPHTDEIKEHLRQKALASPHRRLRRKRIEYNGVWLDSTWELELAKRLDDLNIVWTRPDPVKWQDEQGTTHHYFPDFYLPEYNLYLDPKNPQAVKSQQKKLTILLAQYPNLKILYSLKECTEYIPK